jgi:hypothetical protein
MQTALLPSSDFIKCKVEEQKQQRRVLCLIELGVKSKVILILLTFHFRRVENREWRSQKSCSLLQTQRKEKHVRIAECRGDYLHANKRTKQGAYTVSKVKEGKQQQMLAAS